MHVAEGACEEQRAIPHRVLRAVHDEQRLVGRRARPPSQDLRRRRPCSSASPSSSSCRRDLEDVSITFWCASVCQYSPWLYLLRLHRAGHPERLVTKQRQVCQHAAFSLGSPLANLGG